MKFRNQQVTPMGILCSIAIAIVYCISVLAMQPAFGQNVAQRFEARQSPQNATNQDQHNAQQSEPQSAQPDQKMPKKTIVLTGTIVMNDSAYVLRDDSGIVYKLDDQEKARFFEGKLVKVTGKLEASINLLHVDSIEESKA